MSSDPPTVGDKPLETDNSLDVSLSRAIDAMSLLREDLRREGLMEEADSLDAVLVRLLKLYIDRDNQKPDKSGNGAANGSRKDFD